MKKTRFVVTMLILSLLLSSVSMVAADPGVPALEPQDLDYTENPVDVPNPDRGFYRANDGNVIPVTGTSTPSITGANGSTADIGTSNTVPVETRIVQAYFDLRNYSSNAPTSRGTRYTASYRAPDGQVGAGNPYPTHFAYWKDNVYSTWPRGTSQPISDAGLAYIRSAMQQCRDGQASIIMRFNYDGQGYSWVDVDHPIDGYIDASCSDVEPDKDMILTHIAQLKPIFQEYEDVIMGVDGGFFGPWGEMHSTTFGRSKDDYTWLLNALIDAVPASRSIMVHAGAYLAWHNAKNGTNYTFANLDTMPAPALDSEEARFGFFNDSYAADSSDWGSLSEGSSMIGGSFNRGRVATWIRKQNNYYGGEAQGDDSRWNRFPWVGWEASYAQTTYLNRDYETSVHNRWNATTYNAATIGTTLPTNNGYSSPYYVANATFDTLYDGRKATEYFRDRLGYRFVLRDANASGEVAVDGTLEFDGKVQNVGFGNQVNKKDVSVILLGTDGTEYTALTDIDSRLWRPSLDSRATNTSAWHDLDFNIDLADFDITPPAGEYDIYLKIQDAKETTATKRAIQFANNGGIYNATIAANKIGSTEVVEAAVVPVPLTAISLNATTLELLDDGATATLSVMYDPVDTTDDKTVIWTTDNKSVATVVDGVVTPHAVGDATITARVGSFTATCDVTVSDALAPRPLPQNLDYTENPIDIPNPDRGFYRPQTKVIPVSGSTTGSIPNLTATITGTSTSVAARIVYFEFDMRQFSSNAPLQRRPAGPWNAGNETTYGTTQPLNATAMEYIENQLKAVQASEATAIVKFNYDGSGYTYIDSGVWDMVVHDPEPGAPEGRAWYDGLYAAYLADGGNVTNTQEAVDEFEAYRDTYRILNPAVYTEPGATSDSCGIAGHEEKNWVQYHLWQLKDIFSEYEECIMAVKGGIFGAWGEMHSSSYARTPEGYHWLINAYMQYLPESRSILAHMGGALAWQNEEYGTDYSFANLPPVPERGTPEQRIGMFNDSFSRGEDGGYYNDNGSLSEGYALVGDGTEEIFEAGGAGRNNVFQWLANQKNFYGGETVSNGGSTNVYAKFPNVPYEASIAGLTHLNTSYSSSTLGPWDTFIYNEANVTAPFMTPHDGETKQAIFDPVYDGRKGMEFMRDRLGYRFVVRDANTLEETPLDGALEFEGLIQNVGFGHLVNKKDVKVILKGAGGTYTALTDLDARDWTPDLDGRATNTAAHRDMSFTVNMEDFDAAPPLGDYDIYLKLNDPLEEHATRRSIRFANNGAMWDATIAANKIGSTEVVEGAIEPVPLTGISLNASTLSLLDNGTPATLAVTYDPVDTTDDKTVTWTTDNKSVATVVDGVVTPHAVGDATITARVGSFIATCDVTVSYTVTPKPLTAINLDKTTLSINEGASDALTVTYDPADTTDDQTVVWSTDNKSVATVADGVVNAVAPGTATITAKVGNFTATCDVTVNHLITPIPLTSISLDATALAMTEGDSDTLTVTYDPANTTVDKTVTWSTDNKSVATVVGGVVTAVAAGEADITAKVGTLTATCTVTVAALPPVIVKSTKITLNKEVISLKVGHSESLGTKIEPANVTSHHKTWKSSNEAVATVNSVGKITAKKVGTANITVTTTDSGKTDVCVVTVTPAKIAKPAKVTKVNAKVGKTKANISWKKASKALGYEVTYSTDKKFKKGKATNTITINKAVTKKLIKNLQSNKTYYFKVRAINKNADGKTQYGKWSNKIKAKIK